VALPAVLHGNPVGGGAAGAQARRDLLARPRATRVLGGRCVPLLDRRLSAWSRRRGAAWAGAALGPPALRGGERLWHPLARCCRLRSGRGSSPRGGGPRRGDGRAQGVRPLEAIRRGMRPTVRGHGRPQARGLIAGRLEPLPVAPRPGRRQQLLPRGVSACLGRWLHAPGVAHGISSHQAPPPCHGGLRRHRAVWGGPRGRQAGALLTAGRHEGRFHAPVDPWLHAVGRADQPIAARDAPAQPHETPPPGPHVGGDAVARPHPPMQAGEPRHTVPARHDRWTRLKALLVRAPCLPRGAGPGKPLGDVPRGEARGFARVRRRQEGRTLEALPTLVAILVAAWRLGDDRAHRALLGPCFACGVVLAKEGEGAWWFHPFVVPSLCLESVH